MASTTIAAPSSSALGQVTEPGRQGRHGADACGTVEDPHDVAQVYNARTIVLSKAKLGIGLEAIGDRIPTDAEIEEAVGGNRSVVVLRPR